MPEDMHSSEAGSDNETINAGTEIQERIGQLENELEDARSRALRVMADFQNYQRRAVQNEQVARQQGVASLAYSIVNVLDHFDLALAQDTSKASSDQILAGVRVIRDELMKALQNNGIGVLNPERGELFVPGRHEAVMQQAADDVDPGHIVSTFQPGYTLAGRDSVPDRVLRPAKVAVAPTE